MASAWGNSWSTFWGNSWGSVDGVVTPPPPAPPARPVVAPDGGFEETLEVFRRSRIEERQRREDDEVLRLVEMDDEFIIDLLKRLL